VIFIIYQIIIEVGIFSILTFSLVNVFATDTNPINATEDFSTDLKSKIKTLVSNSINDTDSILNSSLLTNESNQTSSNIIISKSKVTSSLNSNDSGSSSSSSIIKDQVKTINGVCTSIKVGGNGNDVLASSGNCDDELTGGPGADKFMCGEGNDTVRDYDPKEGDILLDKQNCETIL
jgi:hypothetical protein